MHLVGFTIEIQFSCVSVLCLSPGPFSLYSPHSIKRLVFVLYPVGVYCAAGNELLEYYFH